MRVNTRYINSSRGTSSFSLPCSVSDLFLLFLYYALWAHGRCKHLTNTLLHYITLYSPGLQTLERMPAKTWAPAARCSTVTTQVPAPQPPLYITKKKIAYSSNKERPPPPPHPTPRPPPSPSRTVCRTLVISFCSLK